MSTATDRMIAVGETDARIFELNLKLRRIPHRLADARRQLEAEEALLNEVLEPWTKLETEVRERDATIKIALDSIEKFEEHMKQVTTQKEYMAARKQVDEARRLNTRLQDEILERRVQQEELAPRLEERRGTYDKVLETYQAEEAVIESEQAELEKEVAELTGRVQEELKELGDNAIALYKRLMKGGRQPAIVPVSAGSCMGCNMALPPQTYNLLLAANGQLFTCPTCQRIIYHQPPPEQPAEAAQADAAAG
ncbi:MAG TPA: C4-type zinc ribbon domain-containing protein [bacterium]|nr:C4-type zinc ribbon domain-containing protein [bacterium]